MGVNECLDDRLHHTIQIFQNIIVPESQNAKSFFSQPAITVCVVRKLIAMLPTIDFDDQTFLEANEIHDEGTEWRLPPETRPIELAAAQRPPQFSFGISHCGAQLSRVIALLWR